MTAEFILCYIYNSTPGHVGFSFKELYLHNKLLYISIAFPVSKSLS